MRFTPVSAKIRAIISICCCAALTVAATAVAVLDCSAPASNPADALDMPVRASLTSSMYCNTGKAAWPTNGILSGCICPAAL